LIIVTISGGNKTILRQMQFKSFTDIRLSGDITVNGFVYIFKNKKANRVKVGMTTNPIADRLKAFNKNPHYLEYFNGDKRLPLSVWSYSQAYETTNYVEVEKLAHKYLREYKDKDAPIGEVFKCSVEIAIEGVEDALKDLGLFDEAIKVEVKD